MVDPIHVAIGWCGITQTLESKWRANTQCYHSFSISFTEDVVFPILAFVFVFLYAVFCVVKYTYSTKILYFLPQHINIAFQYLLFFHRTQFSIMETIFAYISGCNPTDKTHQLYIWPMIVYYLLNWMRLCNSVNSRFIFPIHFILLTKWMTHTDIGIFLMNICHRNKQWIKDIIN